MSCMRDAGKGFTLLEVIIVMILAGLVGALGSIGYARVVEGMVFAKKNAETIQKGQIAMTKLVREFNNISNVSEGAGPTSITFTSIKDGTAGTRTVTFSNNRIIFNEGAYDDTMVDRVSDFQLKYYRINSSTDQGTWLASSRVIEITLKLTGANDVVSTFTARVRPRNFERR